MGRIRGSMQRNRLGRGFTTGIIGLGLLAAPPAEAVLSAAADLVQGPLLDAHDQGLGRDLTVAIYEPEACIDRNHPDFDLITFLPRIPEADCNPGSGRNGVIAHATKVTSALATARPDGSGGRRLAGLFAGRVFEVDSTVTVQQSGSEQAMLERDPDFVNISKTTALYDAFWIDAAVWEQRVFVANGSGNDGPDPQDVARCWAYNSLCVGGYDHRGTLGPFRFGDDLHHPGTSWRNAPGSGREEPDLVGVYYQRLASPPRTGQWHGNEGGTSYATPSVLGLAALLTANHRDVLYRQPTLLRALLLASASHPVHDDSSKRAGIPIVADGIDDRSGGGVPRGDRASTIVDARRFFAGKLDRDADFDGERLLRQSLAFPVAEGERVRVALAWDNCPSRSLRDQDLLAVDLDLTVRGPDHDIRDDLPTELDRSLYQGNPQPTATPQQELAPEVAEAPPSGVKGAPGAGKGRRVGHEKKAQLLGGLDFLTPNLPAPELALDPTPPTGDDRLDGAYSKVKTVISNPSRVDNYELVEFEAPVGGTYEIEIRALRWNVCEYDAQRGRPGTQTHLAVAWDVL